MVIEKLEGTGTASDIRLKKNISPIAHPIDTLMKLRGVLFDWRWDEKPEVARYRGRGRDTGVIAQEVEKAFPYAMDGEIEGGYKAVDYKRLVPLLIESVKELKAANDNQAAEIRELKAKMKLQDGEIGELRKAMGAAR